MGRRLGSAGRVYVVDVDGVAHSFDPGDEVPKWAAQQITNPKAWGEVDGVDAAEPEAAPTGDGDASGDAVKPYPKWKKDDLQAEVTRRNEGRDEDDLIVVEGKGTVADLAAGLEGDDVAQADSTE